MEEEEAQEHVVTLPVLPALCQNCHQLTTSSVKQQPLQCMRLQLFLHWKGDQTGN